MILYPSVISIKDDQYIHLYADLHNDKCPPVLSDEYSTLIFYSFN